MNADHDEPGIILTIAPESAQALAAKVALQNQADIEFTPVPGEKARIVVDGTGSRLDGRGLLIKIVPSACH